MEYILIMLTTIGVILLKDAASIDSFIKKYYWYLSVLVFPILFYFTIVESFSISKLVAFAIIIAGSLFKYSPLFKDTNRAQ